MNENTELVKALNALQLTVENAITSTPKRVYDTIAAAAYLNMSAEWLKKLRKKGAEQPGKPVPKYIKIGGKSIKYLQEDLDDYLSALKKFEHSAQELLM